MFVIETCGLNLIVYIDKKWTIRMTERMRKDKRSTKKRKERKIEFAIDFYLTAGSRERLLKDVARVKLAKNHTTTEAQVDKKKV